MEIRAIVISDNNSTIELLKSYTNECKGFSFLAGVSDFNKAYSAIQEFEEILVIVDISGYQEQALNFVSKITSDFPKCRVITLSDRPDINLIVRAMRVGASNFVGIPIIKEEYQNILAKIYGNMSGENAIKSACRVISIYSNKGGIGKTSIATNLALELAKITKENVALIDFNFQSGDISAFLDLKPTFNVSYMLQNLDKINKDFLLSTMERYKETSLYVLSDPPYFNQNVNIPLKDISKLFDILRETFSYVIVDTSGGFDKTAMKALELSDLILLVTIVNLPALRNCQRCLEMFESMNIDKNKIQILVNRFMENDEISAKEIEDVLGRNLYWKIPNNYPMR